MRACTAQVGLALVFHRGIAPYVDGGLQRIELGADTSPPVLSTIKIHDERPGAVYREYPGICRIEIPPARPGEYESVGHTDRLVRRRIEIGAPPAESGIGAYSPQPASCHCMEASQAVIAVNDRTFFGDPRVDRVYLLRFVGKDQQFGAIWKLAQAQPVVVFEIDKVVFPSGLSGSIRSRGLGIAAKV